MPKRRINLRAVDLGISIFRGFEIFLSFFLFSDSYACNTYLEAVLRLLSSNLFKFEDKVFINLVPHTVNMTNLKMIAPGSLVNIEVDILARYAEKLLINRDSI